MPRLKDDDLDDGQAMQGFQKSEEERSAERHRPDV
jgi:hypothetical protein